MFLKRYFILLRNYCLMLQFYQIHEQENLTTKSKKKKKKIISLTAHFKWYKTKKRAFSENNLVEKTQSFSFFSWVFIPLRLLSCSQDRAGWGDQTWGRAPREVFPPDQPRVSSCGGLTPGPSCLAVGCNADAGVLAFTRHEISHGYQSECKEW